MCNFDFTSIYKRYLSIYLSIILSSIIETCAAASCNRGVEFYTHTSLRMGYFWGDDARLRLSIERSRDRVARNKSASNAPSAASLTRSITDLDRQAAPVCLHT